MNKRFTFLSMVAMTMVSFTLLAADKPATKGAEVGQWTMDQPAALTLAKSANKINFLCFTGSDWCGWCKLMEKNVFSTDAWKAFAKENLVLTWIDFPRDATLVPEELKAKNKATAEKYGVNGYPTYVILNAEGVEIGRLGASQEATAESFINDVKSVLILKDIEKLLSKEDFEAFTKINAELEALKAKSTTWIENIRKEAQAFQAQGKEPSEAWMAKFNKEAQAFQTKGTDLNEQLDALREKAKAQAQK